MNTESKDQATQTTSQKNDNYPESTPDSGSDQNRSGIMDNAMGKTNDIFEDQNVPNEGEVGNTANEKSVYNGHKDPKPGDNADADDEDEDMDDSDDVEPDEDFDLEDVDLDETNLDDDVLKDMDEEDDLDEDDEDEPLM